MNFSDTMGALASEQVWVYESPAPGSCEDVAGETFRALQKPHDFPPLEAAIVPGDQVALAVDPNVPAVAEVVRGALQSIRQTDASQVQIVVGDEAGESTMAAISAVAGDAVRVSRHVSDHREFLRYLGADEAADPIYLSRNLVDADFVLPITAGRPLDACGPHDLTGMFPGFADSAARARHRLDCSSGSPSESPVSIDANEPAWMLGVQIVLSVTVNERGEPGKILAGTPDAIRKQLTPTRRLPDEFPPPAPLVVAALDGDAQQQTWVNAARAAAAASRYAEPQATIVLWTEISESPSSSMTSLGDGEASFEDEPLIPGEDFPRWNESIGAARTLSRIASEHRLLVHSQLDQETIEAMGLSAIATADELHRLSEKLAACGVLRAAPFAGTTVDAPHLLTDP